MVHTTTVNGIRWYLMEGGYFGYAGTKRLEIQVEAEEPTEEPAWKLWHRNTLLLQGANPEELMEGAQDAVAWL